MERRIRRKRLAGREDAFFFLCLGLLAASFLAGIVLGQVSARKNPDAVDSELGQYLRDYCALDVDEEDSGRVFLSALLIYFRYPLLAFFLGFAAPGILLIPAVSAACGFFLSFSACCFTGAFGETGLLVALAVFGLRCLVTLPCFFVLAVPALQSAVTSAAERFSGRGRRLLKSRGDGERWLRLCVIMAILLAGALAEVFVSPALLRLVLQEYLL